ncbi:MAG: hypothetical protein QOF45_1271 [Gaiellaceae bacterium]|nr:hypothetical protein [Gaiellaceae bacterium]
MARASPRGRPRPIEPGLDALVHFVLDGVGGVLRTLPRIVTEVLRAFEGVVGAVLGLAPRVLGVALLLERLVAGELAFGFLEIPLDPIRIHVDPFRRLQLGYSLVQAVSNRPSSG